MDPLSLQQLSTLCGGSLEGAPELQAVRICSDSRSVQKGDLFIALRGGRFDGHDFLEHARDSGAVAAMVDRAEQVRLDGFDLIRVDDTLLGLQRLAHAYRRKLGLRVVGVTGSNGKTSTKDMAAAVLSQRFRTTKTEGNLNNHIGVPLTILASCGADEAGVFEVAMNHPGEIAPLAEIIAPTSAIVTNIGVAHIEFMATRENIAREKGQLLAALPPSGVAILPAEDEFLEALAAMTQANVFLTGIHKGDLRAENVRQRPEGCTFDIVWGNEIAHAELPVPGLHMVRNALLAVAAGLTAEIPLEECVRGLAKVTLTHGRLQRRAIRGAVVFDDTYNANPDSVIAALSTLAQVPAKGRRIAVLGQMAELGTASESGHRDVGRAAAEVPVDSLIAVGKDAAWIAESARERGVREVHHVPDTASAAEVLGNVVREGDLVLVKGSRSMRMERVIEALERAS